MKAYRVWSTWLDDPELDTMCSRAFEKSSRAQVIANQMNKEHRRLTKLADDEYTPCIYVVRPEEIPRAFTWKGEPDRVVMCVLGDDDDQTDVSRSA